MKGGGFNEGSLLRRTLLHVGTFALGSLAVVTLLSFTLVSIAKSLLPSQTTKAADGSAQKADAPDDADTSKPAGAKTPKPKRARTPAGSIAEEESPNRDADK